MPPSGLSAFRTRAAPGWLRGTDGPRAGACGGSRIASDALTGASQGLRRLEMVARYEILGPLRVVDEGGNSFITARKIEALLAALLIRADRVVSADQLITEIWRERSPRRATACLHVYVSSIRKFLSRPGRADSPVTTRPPRYLLRLGGGELDLPTCER